MTLGAPQFLLPANRASRADAVRVVEREASHCVVAASWRTGPRAAVEPDAARPRIRVLRLVLWFAGVALLILALARPQWGSDIEIVEQRVACR